MRQVIYFLFYNPNTNYPLSEIYKNVKSARGSIHQHIDDMLRYKMIYVDRIVGVNKLYRITPEFSDILLRFFKDYSAIPPGIYKCLKCNNEISVSEWSDKKATIIKEKGKKDLEKIVYTCPNCNKRVELREWQWRSK